MVWITPPAKKCGQAYHSKGKYCMYTFIGYTKMPERCLVQKIILKRNKHVKEKKKNISLIQKL